MSTPPPRSADPLLRASHHLPADRPGAGEPPAEAMRRLMQHRAGRLQDDAGIVPVEWRTGAAAEPRR